MAPEQEAHLARTRQQRRDVYCSAVSFVVREHARQLTLGEVARHTLTSTRQMQRVLAGEGTSFRRLLLRVRMKKAARLLQTEAPISEVARTVGYLEPAAFSKAFRSDSGCSPSAWRQTHR